MDSNMNVTVSPSSAAFIVTISSFPAHFKILARLAKLMPARHVKAGCQRHAAPPLHHAARRSPTLSPILMFLSQRKCSKPSERSNIVTSDTWELSIAWSWKPALLQSKFASVTKSFTASTTFFSRLPCTSLASNMSAAARREGVTCSKRLLQQFCVQSGFIYALLEHGLIVAGIIRTENPGSSNPRCQRFIADLRPVHNGAAKTSVSAGVMANHVHMPACHSHAALLLALREQLQVYGFDVVHPFPIQVFNTQSPPEHQLPTFDRSSTLAVVIGNSNRLWAPFVAVLAENQHLAVLEDPLDEYTEQKIALAVQQAVALCCGRGAAVQPPSALHGHGRQQHADIAYEIRFSHHTEPGRFVNMLRIAQLSGLAYYSSTTHLCMHPTYGPWFALRAVAVFDCDGPDSGSSLQLPCPHPELEAEAAAEMLRLEGEGGFATWQQHWQDWAALRALGGRYTDPQ